MAWIEWQLVGDVPHQELQVILEGDTTYTLRFTWNERGESWFVALLDDQALDVIRSGVRLVPGFPLFARDLPGFFVFEAPDGMRGEMADLTRGKLKYGDATERAA